MDPNSKRDCDAAADAYVEWALWTDADELGDDWSLWPERRKRLTADLYAFLADESIAADLAELDPAQVGHDFWLTRNRHGAGFWDRGLGAAGDRLTAAAHAYGEEWLGNY